MRKLVLIFLLAVIPAAAFAQTPKYIFYFIGDGMGPNQAYLTYMCNKISGENGGTLNFYEFPVVSTLSTYSANNIVTDSAASGTALATGSKANNSTLGLNAAGEPVNSVAVKAKRKGMGVGLVTSTSINHATPAAFYAHVENRGQYNAIIEEYLRSDVDFAAGAGFYKEKYGQKPAKYWIGRAEQSGVVVYQGKNSYKPVSGKRVLCLGDDPENNLDLQYAIDRTSADTELSDFTSAAVDYLYSNFKTKGFFLMVEGSSIDHCCHINDAASMYYEVNDMAKSVDIALKFLREHPSQTLIVVAADHETGGMTIFRKSSADAPARILSQKASKEALTAAILNLQEQYGNNVTWAQVKDLLRTTLGLWDTVPVSHKGETEIIRAYSKCFLENNAEDEKTLYATNNLIASVAVKVLNEEYFGLHWSTRSHTGARVVLYATGAGANKFATCRDNSEVPQCIAKVANLK